MRDVVPWGSVEAYLFITPLNLVTESVKAVFAKESTKLAPIPGRLTSVLQPLVTLE